MIGQLHLAVVGGAAPCHHAALAERRIAHGLDRLARRRRAVDVRQLDALHAHVEQPQDEGGIEARRAHDRRDADALGRHHHQLHVAQVEAGVLHVDERGVEAGMADDLDDLRIGDAADISAERDAAIAHDPLDAIFSHGPLLPTGFGEPRTSRARRLRRADQPCDRDEVQGRADQHQGVPQGIVEAPAAARMHDRTE